MNKSLFFSIIKLPKPINHAKPNLIITFNFTFAKDRHQINSSQREKAR